MLIRFQISNFLSFKEQVEFTMVPGLVRKLSNNIFKDPNGWDILRSAVVYGANASGKSNLIKALAFAQLFIVEGTKVGEFIGITPFKLCQDSPKIPSMFNFEIRHNGRYFIFGFKVDKRKVHEEWLYERKGSRTILLYERKINDNDISELKLSKKIPERKFLEFIGKGTRPNQLFLTESVTRNSSEFNDVYDWFQNVLTIIFPKSKYLPLDAVAVEDSFGKTMSSLLERLGTGICGFKLVQIEPVDEFPSTIREKFLKDFEPGIKHSIFEHNSGNHYIVEVTAGGSIIAQKLMFTHQMGDCEDQIEFASEEESDGTNRLFDLLPGVLSLREKKERVMVIDEFDRSLHPSLTHEIMEFFLADTTLKSQLIFTTHETHLLDLNLLRRDQIWFVEKSTKGFSTLYSLEDFAPRYDKDIRTGYLIGRFGGIPIFGGNIYESEGEDDD